ncbi:TMEM175 family protein [soil metagenome]
MNKTRLEAFSDGVLAIIITIMVLELKIPHEVTFKALFELWNVFLSYLLSFVFIGIYWGNHHHLLHTVHHVNSKIIWANMALLFFLSLIPFATAYMGENHFAELPMAVYAVVLFLCGNAYFILHQTIMAHHTLSTKLIDALQMQKKKGIASTFLYLTSIATAFYYPAISGAIFIFVAIMWIVPDKNIENAFKE